MPPQGAADCRPGGHHGQPVRTANATPRSPRTTTTRWSTPLAEENDDASRDHRPAIAHRPRGAGESLSADCRGAADLGDRASTFRHACARWPTFEAGPAKRDEAMLGAALRGDCSARNNWIPAGTDQGHRSLRAVACRICSAWPEIRQFAGSCAVRPGLASACRTSAQERGFGAASWEHAAVAACTAAVRRAGRAQTEERRRSSSRGLLLTTARIDWNTSSATWRRHVATDNRNHREAEPAVADDRRSCADRCRYAGVPGRTSISSTSTAEAAPMACIGGAGRHRHCRHADRRVPAWRRCWLQVVRRRLHSCASWTSLIRAAC